MQRLIDSLLFETQKLRRKLRALKHASRFFLGCPTPAWSADDVEDYSEGPATFIYL
jgi:hypothetical protein